MPDLEEDDNHGEGESNGNDYNLHSQSATWNFTKENCKWDGNGTKKHVIVDLQYSHRNNNNKRVREEGGEGYSIGN